jgi:hypothetical protein
MKETSVKSIWTNEMHKDLIKQKSLNLDFEKHLVSVLKAEFRKNKINKIFKKTN